MAILDLDFHHGNGTQDIFYETDSVLFVSLHHTPHGAYPYFSGFEDEIGYHTSTARHDTRHDQRHATRPTTLTGVICG